MRGDAAVARRTRADAGRATDRRRLDATRTRRSRGRGPLSTDATARRPQSIRFGGETLDRLTVLARLATEADRTARRALFESLAPVWRVVDGDGGDASPYRRLLRASAARWASDGSPIEANAVALGLRARVARGDAPRRSWLRGGRSSGRAASSRGTTGTRSGRPRVGSSRSCRPTGCSSVNRRYLAALGADPRELGIAYDVLPRPGRPPVPVAFTLGMGAWAADQPPTGPWTPRPPWVFATYAEGGLGNLARAAPRERPCAPRGRDPDAPGIPRLPGRRAPRSSRGRPMSSAGTSTSRPGSVAGSARPRSHARRVLEPVRRGHARRLLGALRDRAAPPPGAPPERRLDRGDGRRPRRRAAPGVVVVGDPRPADRRPGLSGQLRAVGDRRGRRPGTDRSRSAGRGSTGDPGWYRFVADALFAPGASRPPADLLETFLGGPLTAEPLLADLRRGG